MEFDMEKVFWGTRMMAQEYSWPWVRGFSSCVSVSHSQSLQTPLHFLSPYVQWAGLLPPVYSRQFTPSSEADRVVSASVSFSRHAHHNCTILTHDSKPKAFVLKRLL